jgi:hypothetical protein
MVTHKSRISEYILQNFHKIWPYINYKVEKYVVLRTYLSIYSPSHPPTCLHTDLPIDISVHPSIHPSMALQPFVGPWPLLQFRNHFYTVCRTHWTGDQSVARPLHAHTGQHKHRIKSDNIHTWSGIRTYDPNISACEDSSCLGPRGHCERR